MAARDKSFLVLPGSETCEAAFAIDFYLQLGGISHPSRTEDQRAPLSLAKVRIDAEKFRQPACKSHLIIAKAALHVPKPNKTKKVLSLAPIREAREARLIDAEIFHRALFIFVTTQSAFNY